MRTPTEYGWLMDYNTGDFIRPATREERKASDEEVKAGREEGVILVDERANGIGPDAPRVCWVDPEGATHWPFA